MKTMNFVWILKSLMRTVIDGCILPGTANGTEILWLYGKEWKKEISALCFAIIFLLQIGNDSSGQRVYMQQQLAERETAS